MKGSAALFSTLLLLLALSPECRGEVPWHPFPPGSEAKSLPEPRDPERFIRVAYRRLLGREPLPAELENRLKELERPGMKRDRMILELQGSDEFFVRQSFLTIMKRPPRSDELEARRAYLEGGGDRRDVIRNLLGSGEYRKSLKHPKR